MSKKDKKQRHRAKREAKKKEMRRKASVSPIKRLAEARGEMECWISDDFKSFGQLQIFVYKRGGGLGGIACFLIDRGVVGLKDAWTRLDVIPEEFEKMLETSEQNGIPLHECGVEEARKWVAAGARWAHDNGMRLPKDWAKAAMLIDGVGDWHNADVSQFVKEFAGHPEDLRQRLIGEPLETFLKRKDIQIIFSDLAPYKDQQTGSYSDWGVLDELEDEDDEELDDETLESLIPDEQIDGLLATVAPLAENITEKTKARLLERGQEPSPELFPAWQNLLICRLMAGAALQGGPQEEIDDFAYQLLQGLSERVEESRAAEFDRAIEQVSEHLEADPQIMQQEYLNSLPPEAAERPRLSSGSPHQAPTAISHEESEHSDQP